MNKSRINRVCTTLYAAENLPSALREITRYIIYAMISECKFNYDGVIEDVTLDFRELRTDGILDPKDVLSIELSLLSCILDFVEKDVCRGEISRKSVTPFVDMFIIPIPMNPFAAPFSFFAAFSTAFEYAPTILPCCR